MARIKSRFPVWDGLSPEQSSYLADLDRVVPSRDDLASSASTTDIVTAINLLFSHMREAGQMKKSS